MSEIPGQQRDPGAKEADRPGRPGETDVDRGPAAGAALALLMTVVFQAVILGLFQSGVVGGDVGLWEPLRYLGLTQGIYIVPSVFLFVSRKTPRMAIGMTVVAAVLLLGTVVALAV